LLEGLNQSVEQDPIEAPIAKADAVLVMLIEGVHGIPRLVDSAKLIHGQRLGINGRCGDGEYTRVFLRGVAAGGKSTEQDIKGAALG